MSLTIPTLTATERITSIARRATVHNAGATVWEITRDRELDAVILRMSSWPRADEAVRALRHFGYEAEHMVSDGGHPRVIVSHPDTVGTTNVPAGDDSPASSVGPNGGSEIATSPAGTSTVTCLCGHSIDRHTWAGCVDRVRDPVGVCSCSRRPSQVAASAIEAASTRALLTAASDLRSLGRGCGPEYADWLDQRAAAMDGAT